MGHLDETYNVKGPGFLYTESILCGTFSTHFALWPEASKLQTYFQTMHQMSANCLGMCRVKSTPKSYIECKAPPKIECPTPTQIFITLGPGPVASKKQVDGKTMHRMTSNSS